MVACNYIIALIILAFKLIHSNQLLFKTQRNITMHTKRILLASFICTIILALSGYGQNKYVGVKLCGMCHKAEKQGNQLSIWQKSKHAEAFKTLLGSQADSIVKARGMKKPASEAPECLKCHVIGNDLAAGLFEKTFDFKEGVQCEFCHGPGSAYKTIAVMKDKAKAVAAGLKLYKDPAEVEKFCRTCHNEKSPSFKGFKFDEMWGKIKHPKPKT